MDKYEIRKSSNGDLCIMIKMNRKDELVFFEVKKKK